MKHYNKIHPSLKTLAVFNHIKLFTIVCSRLLLLVLVKRLAVNSLLMIVIQTISRSKLQCTIMTWYHTFKVLSSKNLGTSKRIVPHKVDQKALHICRMRQTKKHHTTNDFLLSLFTRHEDEETHSPEITYKCVLVACVVGYVCHVMLQ